MKQSTYLYGDNYNAKILRELAYILALHRKVIWSQELVAELIDVHHSERDMRRINDSINSQKFNRKLIEECYEKDIQ